MKSTTFHPDQIQEANTILQRYQENLHRIDKAIAYPVWVSNKTYFETLRELSARYRAQIAQIKAKYNL